MAAPKPKADQVRIETDRSWESGRSKSVTFVVTEDCQLRCRYCYMVGKNKAARLEFDVARKAIDYLLTERELVAEGSVVWDFIGGEPFLEVGLIDRICDYFKLRAYELSHPWFESYRFSFSTNGLLYGDERVQRFIAKNAAHLSVQITVDGTRAKHDLQRVYPDGRGSYDDVVRNIPRWLEQFPKSSTKVTISSDDIPHIKESVLHLWGLGIREININGVFEDVWKPGDDERFEDQLVSLADEIIARKLYETHSCSFFSKSIGRPYFDNTNWCGAGRMLAIDHLGELLPLRQVPGLLAPEPGSPDGREHRRRPRPEQAAALPEPGHGHAEPRGMRRLRRGHRLRLVSGGQLRFRVDADDLPAVGRPLQDAQGPRQSQ